ncbi:MAG: ABC transporter ATP-binding protein [Clostridiales bacterium]|nr:ABC transporter ATP-binding protein [Clostridiales bacterium]
MASLNLNGVSKAYLSGVTALHNVSLEAEDKEFIVIVGGEKCGKSTLLKVIAGLEEPASGTVTIGGKNMADVETKERDIAMVFRQDPLNPNFTVFDNMAYGLRLRKAPQALIEQRVKIAANILGLTEVLYRKPKVLSAADRQRIAIGRAIVREPKLYLFDEPLAGIDENLRRDMLNVIINVQARMQGTFVYATKNLSEALTIGTRLVILKNGLVQQIDTPSNLYDYPANTYVAFYIGSPTINFLQNAKVVKEGDGYFAEFEGGKLALAENIVSRFEKIEEYAGTGKKIIIGIRHEDISTSAEGNLTAKFNKTQSDGEATYAECDLSGQPVLATLGSKAVNGAEVKLAVDLSRLYIFDSETRLTLLKRDGGYKNTGHKDADRLPFPYPEEQAVIEKLTPKKEDTKKKLR